MAVSRSQIGQRLQSARKKAGLTQRQVATELDTDSVTVSRWERGAVDIRAAVLADLAALYGVEVATLTGDESLGQDVPRETLPPSVREAPMPPYGDPDAWPAGWRARAYRLQLEAAEAGAPDSVIGEVRRLMLNPELQVKWHGGQKKGRAMDRLDGIEAAARALLRSQGYMVRAERPETGTQ